MYQFAAARYTSTIKLPAIYLRFQTEENFLSVDKREITAENAFHGDLFEIEDNHESSKDEKTWFQVCLEICYSCLNLQTAKYVHVRFSNYCLNFAIFKLLLDGFESLE